MKNNSKNTGRSRKPTAKNRHAKSKQKSVIIDLTAEKVVPKSKTAKPRQTATSVPKSTSRPKHIAAAAAKGKKPPSEQSTDSTASSIDFGKTTAPRHNSTESKAINQTTQQDKQQPNKMSSPPPSSAPTPSSSNRGGLVSKVAAGILGGAIALTGAGALQYLGFLSSPGATEATKRSFASLSDLNKTKESLHSQIISLEAKLNKEKSAPALDLDALNTRINSTIEARLKKLSASTVSQQTKISKTEIDTISDQLKKNASKLETLQSQLLITDKAVGALKSAVSGGGAGENAGLQTLTKTINALQSKIDAIAETTQSLAVGSNERQDQLTKLQKKLAAQGATQQIAQSQVNDNSALVAVPVVANETAKSITALQSKLEAIIETIQSLAVSSNGRQEQLTDLQKRVSSDSGEDKQAKLEKTIAALQEKLNSVASTTQSLAQTSNDTLSTITELKKQSTLMAKIDKQSASAIAAAALKSDIDRGLPFSDSLNRLKSIAGDKIAFASLANYADKGVPTVGQLADQFHQLEDLIITALLPKPKDDFVSRLMASAKSLVKTKSIKAVDGSSPRALVSQISAGLNAGDLQRSAKVWATLPKPGQNASQQWYEDLSARIAADTLVSKTLQSFILTNTSQ